jgi:tryptophan halogenase|tara:strand:- start:283 stop:576 length:294 start_codon:yes stop_codon:yes gene_type:complete
MLPGMENAASFNGRVITYTASLWNHESYECILYGMHFAADHYRQKFGNTGKPVSMNQELLFRLKAARQGLPPHAVWLEQMTGKAAYPTAYKPHGWVA